MRNQEVNLSQSQQQFLKAFLAQAGKEAIGKKFSLFDDPRNQRYLEWENITIPVTLSDPELRDLVHRGYIQIKVHPVSSIVFTEKVQELSAETPAVASENLETYRENTVAKSREAPDQALEEKQRGSIVSTVKIVSTALIILAIITCIFLLVSVFSRNTSSFPPVDTILLLIIAAVIALGVVGIMKPEQITQVFTGSITSLFGNSTGDKDGKSGGIK